jgi:glutamate N-acetyltransferase/amino-acid N-acetyltransferase
VPRQTDLKPVPGIRLGTVAAGIRKANRRDLVLIECIEGSRVAAVFTRNRACAAPVVVAREHLTRAAPRALVINTGFANAGTGEEGLRDSRASCDAVARMLRVLPEAVLPFSTGVIGERLPVDRLVVGLPGAAAALTADGWNDAAHGIMTTDTVPKGVSRMAEIGGTTITVTGIAKGSGMICPNMATMLGFIATDARVSQEALDACMRRAADASFNRISVDGDTSTNDACVLIATGASGGELIERDAGESYSRLLGAVTEVCTELAQLIVRDGEGATKFVTIDVEGGADDADCDAVARTIAHSPLVKTALFASDPNWGRILAAVGRAPIAALDVDRVAIRLDDVLVVEGGARAAGYTEAGGARVMAKPAFTIRVSLGSGGGHARLWTTDLSHEYVRINAEYRS